MAYMSYEITPTRWPVVAWPRLKQLIGPVEAHIAGGYAAWHMSDRFNRTCTEQIDGPFEIQFHSGLKNLVPSNYPTDLDIFTYNDHGYYSLVSRLNNAGFLINKESKYCTTWEDGRGYLNEDNYSHLRYQADQVHNIHSLNVKLPIQLIKPVFGKNLVEVLDHFDFYAVKFALLDAEHMFAHADAVKCLDSRSLKHAHPEALLTNPFYVLSRNLKYLEKGYKVNYMEMYRMVTTAQTGSLENIEFVQLVDLVKSFSDYLHAGESLGHGEDFRETFEGAYGEWLRYLLSKKS